MTSTTLEKTEEAKMTTKKKSPLSYAQALELIEKSDATIKAAASHRLAPPEPIKDIIFWSSWRKTFGAGVLVCACAITGDIANTIPTVVAMPVGAGSLLLSPIVGAMLSATRLAKILSPVKYRRLLKEVPEQQALVDFKEADFLRVEAKVLKKADKAMKVVNANVKYDGRELIYRNDLGIEGFDIVAARELTAIEREKLAIEKREYEKTQQLALEPATNTENLKELTS